MSILKPEIEERIIQRLRSLVEEFGPESVVVSLPKKWEIHKASLGDNRVRWEFTTDWSIDISVPYVNLKVVEEINNE